MPPTNSLPSGYSEVLIHMAISRVTSCLICMQQRFLAHMRMTCSKVAAASTVHCSLDPDSTLLTTPGVRYPCLQTRQTAVVGTEPAGLEAYDLGSLTRSARSHYQGPRFQASQLCATTSCLSGQTPRTS